jgi:hypothetical protein
MKNTFKKYWRLWALAIGVKSGVTDSEANLIACMRTSLVLLTVIAELCIIANFILNHNFI